LVRVITITNQKGGTGKTTLSALLACGLSELGHKVLLIDLDPQAHLTSFFVKGNELDKYPGSLHMARGGQFKIIPLQQSKGRGRIGLIPSKLSYLVEVYRGQMPLTDVYAVDRRIRREPAINKGYNYVICDTPPELFAPTVWALYAADFIIIPSNFEELSLMGAKLLIKEILPDIFAYKNLKVLGIVLTNITRKFERKTIDKVERNFVEKFLKRQIPLAFRNKFYRKSFFETIVYRHVELRDLVYRPRRWETPIFRIISKNRVLLDTAVKLAEEVINRVEYFQELQ